MCAGTRSLTCTVKALDRNVLFHLLPFVLPISISSIAFSVFLLKGDNMSSDIALAALVFALFLFYTKTRRAFWADEVYYGAKI